MKMKIFASMKGNLTIPNAAIRIAGINGEDLETHISDGVIVLFREEMDAKQLIAVSEFLKEMATDLSVHLAVACGQCDDCGYCYGDEDEDSCPESCANCKSPCHGVELPICMLEEAGINPEIGLQFDTRQGEIIIHEIDDSCGDADEIDVTDYVPEGLLEVLRESDVCLNHLREMLESGEIIYG